MRNSGNRVREIQILGQGIPFWIALGRGFFVVLLGVVLLFSPEKSQSQLVNIMGFFWLTTGIVLLRYDANGGLGKRMSWAIGLAAIISGLIVVTRGVTSHWLNEVVAVELLGAVIFLTGVLHIVSEFQVGQWKTRGTTWVQLLLGIFELALGAMLLFSPLEHGPITYWTATLWALLFGALTLVTALRDRSRARRQDEEAQPQPETDTVESK